MIPALLAATLIAFGGAGGLALFRRTEPYAPILAALGGGFASVAGVALLLGSPPASGSWSGALGFTMLFRYDSLSGVFLLALGLSAGSASLSIALERGRSRFESVAYPLFLASMVMVVGANDGFAFLFAWELMTILSALLILGLRPTRHVLAAGTLYLTVTHAATACVLVAFGLLASVSGGSLAFDAWRVTAPGLAPLTMSSVVLLLMVGFGTKSGVMPFHFWLPRAHPVAPPHVSAVMSGAMIKMGVYGMVRLMFDIMGGVPEGMGLLILAAGAASAVFGVLYAFMQHDLKRLLAFHSIENVGIIWIGLAASLLLWNHGNGELAALALTAALFHTVNHAVFKSLLFLCAGAVIRGTGLYDLNHLGGLGRRMPATMLAFLIGAAAISGLPPLNGFASEWLTFQGLLGAASRPELVPFVRFAAATTIGALGLTAALAVACFVKATGVAFLGLPRSHAAANATEARRPAQAAIAILAVACVALGLAAGPVTATLLTVARGMIRSQTSGTTAWVPALTSEPRVDGVATYAALSVALLLVVGVVVVAGLVAWRSRPVRKADTWTCGVTPEPAFQYTATSFSKPIRIFLRPILMPEREVIVENQPGTTFPRSIRYRSEVTLFLEDRVYRPAHALSLRSADFARRFQGGAIQLYIAYVVAAVIVLLLLAK